MERSRQRAAEREREKLSARNGSGFVSRTPVKDDAWRRDSPAAAAAAPPTPTRAAATLPKEAAPIFRPGAAGGGGWRAREAARAAGGVPSRPESPAPQAAAPKETPAEEDGFQKVPAKAVWKPKRLQGRS